MALSRNALAVIVGILLAYFLTSDGVEPFKLTGKIEAGLPHFRPPDFNTTVNGKDYSFQEMVSELGSSLITIPLISILETVAIAKSFGEYLLFLYYQALTRGPFYEDEMFSIVSEPSMHGA